MYGCEHPFRGTTNNAEWTICEICGDSLRASSFPANMTAENYEEYRAAKNRGADQMLEFLRKDKP